MRRFVATLASTVVIISGLLTLWGLFPGSPVAPLATIMIQFVVVIGALAVLLGVLNLLWVHLRRVVAGEQGWPFSLVLLFSTLIVIGLVTLERLDILAAGSSGFLFNAVQVSVESALAGLLAFFLVYAAARLLRQRMTWAGLLFVLTLIVVLIGWLQLPDLGAFNVISEWLRTVPASAGARGLLIGVALGMTTAGVRVLLGQDPSYRE